MLRKDSSQLSPKPEPQPMKNWKRRLLKHLSRSKQRQANRQLWEMKLKRLLNQYPRKQISKQTCEKQQQLSTSWSQDWKRSLSTSTSFNTQKNVRVVNKRFHIRIRNLPLLARRAILRSMRKRSKFWSPALRSLIPSLRKSQTLIEL